MYKLRLLGSIGAALCAFITMSAQAITVPYMLNPGDTYQLMFVTSGVTQALSTDIAYYNSFVQAQAEMNPALTGTDVGVTYTAIASTELVNARVNAPVSRYVYLVDGSGIVARGSNDMWNGTLEQPIVRDQMGTSVGSNLPVWTGTEWNGTTSLSLYLGTRHAGASAIYGLTGHWDSVWVNVYRMSTTNEARLYALSSVITVSSVPIPSAVWLFGSGLLGLIGLARRKAG